ncbi:hypothetical protein V5799_004108, partial [Amblyomma americanum]
MSTWKLARPSSFLVTAPTRDRTTGTPEGKFLLLLPGRNQTTATITGPKLHNNETCVISFFYTVQGEADSQLKLGVRTTKDGPWKIEWKQSVPTEFFHFIEATVVLMEDEPFQVAFIGEHNQPGKKGYIAIDDVTFWESCRAYHGELPPAPEPTPPPTLCGENEFECASSRECIQLSQVCDFKADCSNGEDESRCGACEFSTDLCGLENEDRNTRFGWSWTTVQDGKKNALFPTTDSQFSEDGAYAVFSLMHPAVPLGHPRSLLTPKLGEIGHSCVVRFYAFVPNQDSAWLILRSVAANDQQRHTWSNDGVGDNNRKQKYGEMGEGHSESRKLEGWRQVLLPGKSDTESEGWEATRKVSCDFSSPADCGWFPERTAGFEDWIYYAGGPGRPTMRWQPTDSASHQGAYLYARNPRGIPATAHLVSIKMSATPDTGRCFTFWYNMWHPNVGKLNLLRRVTNGSRSILWSREGPQGKDWKQGKVQLHSEDPHQLVFEAILNTPNAGMIAIDNFNLTESQCGNDKVCTFESDSCGWQLHNWERTSGSSVLAPQSDHSTQSPSGSFALVRSPSGRMVSPQGWYDTSRHKCLRFWYFMAGGITEALNVTRVSDEGPEESLGSVNRIYVPMRRWFSAAVGLPTSKGMATIVFEGTTSGDPGTAVAVDDISLSEKACPSPGSCTFEEDMCNWFNSRYFSYAQWYRHRGNTVSNSTGVEKDHTLGTKDGFYLLLDAEDLAHFQLASLQSQVLSLGPNVCFRLYYFLKNG